ncbi:Aste57867_12893 [Aphanomyces stellatus]|uniref:Aste57867_12893 protein n=1 Tax=Aphanomyces stellatus TaxID=120398 RepID=A0A485KWT1_9STRA|nr:hypothetical protein As57867_012845 [Aphanomyces stellatus]VFT89740.1 Aste57867_12893 [Aphanomyces stellatus]
MQRELLIRIRRKPIIESIKPDTCIRQLRLAVIIPAKDAAMAASKVVCVTGGSGFIGSHVVKTLLERGYTVHTTVRDIANVKKLAHLKALPGATDRLKFFEADLVRDGSFDEAMQGCSAVMHTASPFFTSNTTRENMVDPAVQGTLTVLKACTHIPSVRRVVLTSSMAAVSVNLGALPRSHVYTESDWSNEEVMEKHDIWYPLSKTVAERKAHEFMKTLAAPPSFDLVVLNPTWVFGPMLQPTLNESSDQIARYLSGALKAIPNSFKCGVDVRDVAEAHVKAFETSAASGRYILIGWQASESAIAARVRALYSSAAVPTAVEDNGKTPQPMVFDGRRAVEDLGLAYIQMPASVESTCASLVEHGLVQVDAAKS